MPTQRGSQIRENIKDTDYELVRKEHGAVIVKDKATGKLELWQSNDSHAGYTLQIGRWGYEFVREVQA